MTTGRETHNLHSTDVRPSQVTKDHGKRGSAVTDLGWPRVNAIIQGPAFVLDDTPAPASAVGGTTSDALPIAGLREAQAVRDAFASVGWSVAEGHEFSLNGGFTCDGVPTSIGFSFDQTPHGVRSWAVATATLMPGVALPSTLKERELLSAVMDYAENPFPSMAGIVRMGRGLTYPDVSEEHWPSPFAQIALDWNVLVPGPSGLRYEPMDPPVRALLVGYHWAWIPDPAALATVITNAVNALPTVLAALGDLQQQDAAAFSRYMGASVPSVQMGARWTELRGSAAGGAPAAGAPFLSSSGNKIGRSATLSSGGPAETPAPTAIGGRFCSNCGTPRTPKDRFCGMCGAAFSID